MHELGDVLKQRRWAHNLTLVEVADRVGVSRRAVMTWEKGERVPGLVHFTRLVEVLQLDAPAMLALVAAVDRSKRRGHDNGGV